MDEKKVRVLSQSAAVTNSELSYRGRERLGGADRIRVATVVILVTCVTVVRAALPPMPGQATKVAGLSELSLCGSNHKGKKEEPKGQGDRLHLVRSSMRGLAFVSSDLEQRY